MAIADDWEVNFVNKVISHVDGVLDYRVTIGDPPQSGDYIAGSTSGATGRILGTVGADIQDTSSTGTVSLTNVSGRFQDNESLTVLDKLNFDGVTNGGFQ